MKDNPEIEEAVLEAACDYLGQVFGLFDPVRFHIWTSIGLTTNQIRVMLLIRDNPGVTAGDLASHLQVTPPTVSGIVDRLAKLSLVQRDEDPTDRRLVRNRLTGKGDAAVSQLERAGKSLTRHILGDMSAPQVQDLVDSLRLFVEAADRVARTAPTPPPITRATPGS